LDSASILVVEDEALIRMAAMQIVEEAGYRVVVAANADEAIIMLESCPGITAVFTDINMPGTMNGLELSRVIRDRWPQMGLIITSARLFARMPENALFVSKPYTPREIAFALQACAA
jgi:CheY-like chemotaxis protein